MSTPEDGGEKLPETEKSETPFLAMLTEKAKQYQAPEKDMSPITREEHEQPNTVMPTNPYNNEKLEAPETEK